MRSILIVEDEYFIAEDCASLARKAGFLVVGPFNSVEEARHHTASASGALIDINVNGMSTYRLIDELLDMGKPVTLYTGYDRRTLPEKYADVPMVTKPHNCAEAIETLRTQMNRARE
ncbi:response regulator [Bradyrhizobium sp. USDA 4473]